MLEQLKRDKNGFIMLNKNKDDITEYKVTKLNLDNEIYYFKSIFSSKGDTASIQKELQDSPQLWSELVSYRVLKGLGVEAVEYDMAKYLDCYGVVSKDFRYIRSSAKEMRKFLATKGYMDRQCTNLATFKQLLDNSAITDNLKRQADLASLSQIGIGQTDCHWNNMAVYSEGGNEGIIMFDNANTIPTFGCEDEEDYKSMLGYVCKIFGIDSKNESWKNYHYNIGNSSNIDTESIRTYLENLNAVLSDGGLKRISSEIKDQCGIAPNQKFIDLMQFGLEYTGNFIESAYDYRVNVLGE